MTSNELLIYEEITNQLQKQFQEVQDMFFYLKNDYEECSFWNFDYKKLNLAFEINEKSKWVAYANYKDESITFIINNLIGKNGIRTIIHEYAHHIAYSFCEANKHTLEFAIISYCLENRFFGESGRSEYFRSYDIHEDKAYHFISINSSEFDSIIKNIRFDSLRELSAKAEKLAEKIRKKSMPYTLAV